MRPIMVDRGIVRFAVNICSGESEIVERREIMPPPLPFKDPKPASPGLAVRRRGTHIEGVGNVAEEQAQVQWPPIRVTSPDFDDMGAILSQMNIPYEEINELSQIPPDAVLLVNCSGRWMEPSESDVSALRQHIQQGGVALVSDFAAGLVEHLVPDEASFLNETEEQEVMAQITDKELARLLGLNQLSIQFDLGGWWLPVTLPSGAKPILTTGDIIGQSEGPAVLAYSWRLDEGMILFTSFHNHAQLSDLEQALLRLMIMMPIATMTGESLTNVHTSWTQTQMRPESITDKRDPIR